MVDFVCMVYIQSWSEKKSEDGGSEVDVVSGVFRLEHRKFGVCFSLVIPRSSRILCMVCGEYFVP